MSCNNQMANFSKSFSMKSSSSFSSHQVHTQKIQVQQFQKTSFHRSETKQSWHQEFSEAFATGQITTQSHSVASFHAEHFESHSAQSWSQTTNKQLALTNDDINYLLNEIDDIDEEDVRKIHRIFFQICPNGEMTKEMFANLVQKIYKVENAGSYAEYAFQLLDRDNNGTLSFVEFALGMQMYKLDKLEDSFGFIFDIFDCDRSGTIDQKELYQMIISICQLLGKSCDKQYAQTMAKKILDSCDKHQRGKITKEEFIYGCKNVLEYCQLLIPNFDQMYDQYGNPQGSSYDFGRDGDYTGYKILIGRLYSDNTTLNDEQMQKPINALKAKGFQVDLAKKKEEIISKLESNDYNVAWITCTNSDQGNDLTSALSDFHSNGGSIFLFADNTPWLHPASEFLDQKFGITLTGDYQGKKILKYEANSYLKAGHFGRHDIFTGINNLFEGETISYPVYPTEESKSELVTVATATDGNPCVAVYDPPSESDEGRLCLDCGFTKLYINWDDAGTARYVVNTSCWLAEASKDDDDDDDDDQSQGGFVRKKCPMADEDAACSIS